MKDINILRYHTYLQINLISPIFDYDPYGKLMRSYTTTPEGEKYLTTQHERDAETGLD